jgi:single-strand DNA-binding protein
MNKFIGIGRLVRDAEIKEMKGGKQLANFSIAITRAYNKEQTDFVNCVAWGKTAEYLGKYAKKGQLVSVDGELNIDKVNDKYYTKVNASSVSILSSKGDVQEQTQTVQTASFDTVEPSFDDFEADLAPKKDNSFDITPDDLPF